MAFSILDFVGRKGGGGDVITERPEAVASDAGIQAQAAPGYTYGLLGGPGPQLGADVVRPKMGLLEGLRQPDSRGLTFGDKLFAAGSVLQGDSGGAAAYLDTQQQRSLAAQEVERQRANLAKRQQAFRAAYQGGDFDPATYAAQAGDAFDPAEVTAYDKAFGRQGQFMQAGGGGLYLTDPRKGTVQQVVAPPPAKLPAGLRRNPETGEEEVDPLQLALYGQRQEVAGQKRAKYRAPPRAPAASSGRPPGY